MSSLIFEGLHFPAILVLGGMRKVVISFQIDERMKASLQKLAEEENRSLSNYVTTVLLEHLKSKEINWRQKETEEEKPDF